MGLEALVGSVGIVLLLGMGLAWHSWMIRPLHRMAREIERMHQTGQLITLSVGVRGHVGMVAAGFNELIEQVEQQKRRLLEQIVELQRVNSELDQLATLKDDFLMTINHQLRTPVTAIGEGVELMRDGVLGPMSDQQQDVVRMIETHIQRLSELMERVLDLCLIKSGQRQLARQPGDLAPLLGQSLERWQPSTSAVTLRLRCEELPPVYMDARAIRDVMDHLLRNALRHAPAHSDVLIRAERSAASVRISITDRGPGMSPEQCARLFEPFVHIYTPEAPGSEGSGLGLAFCRQVIEQHRGSIQADANGGLTVTFALPVASAPFLFEEAFRCASEEAGRAQGPFVLLVATPATPAPGGLEDAEVLLRRHTARHDRFVRVDDATLAIFAVTDRAGCEAMLRRLRGVLAEARLAVALSPAVFPFDGDSPQQLLESVRATMSPRGAQ